MSGHFDKDPSTEFKKILAQYWPSVKKRRENKWAGKPGIFPSSLSFPCDLYCYYEGSGAPALDEEGDPKGLILMDIGTYIHDQVQKAFEDYYKSIGWFYQKEVSIRISELSRGRADGLVISPDNSTIRIEDYKSMGGSGFKNLSSPKSDHVEQLNLYLYASGIKDGMLIYFKRDSPFELKYFPVKLNEKLAEEQMERINKIERAITEESPPEPSPHWRFTSKCVQSCKFRNLCPAAEESTPIRRL